MAVTPGEPADASNGFVSQQALAADERPLIKDRSAASDSPAHNSDPHLLASSPSVDGGVAAQSLTVGVEWTTLEIIRQVLNHAQAQPYYKTFTPVCCSDAEFCHLQLSGYCIALALDFLVTLAVFPGISSAICSVSDEAVSFPCSASTASGRFYGELSPTSSSTS